jgi:hypothetical protein
MSKPAPLLLLTRPDGVIVHVHLARVVKIAPSDAEPATESDPKPEGGSTLTVSTGTGTTDIDVIEYLLNRGPAELLGFLRVTDLQGIPIKINPAYVIFARSREPSGTVLEVYSAVGTEEIYVQDDFDTVSDWWAGVAEARFS